jgi:G3E family GTPase
MTKEVITASGTDKRIPVTLLTGFLGAGKTTILNKLLKHPEMAGAAVLINEFGEVGIDHHLVDSVDESMIILDSGCICCSVQGDLVKALKNLAERSSKREIPPVLRVVIETTGLADPVPVISTLTQDRFVAARYQCDGVITVVDATHALQQLDQHKQAVQQAAMADRLLISKCDLASTTNRDALYGRLEALNPGVAKIEVHQGHISPNALFGGGIYSSSGKTTNISAWLGEVTSRAADAEHRREEAQPPPSTHNHGHHTDGVCSFVINFPEPVPWYNFSVVMGRILQKHGPKILRVKGLMNIAGDCLPRVIHCVQDVAYPPTSLTKWPAQSPFENQQGRLVFITQDLTEEDVNAIRFMLSKSQNRVAGSQPSIAACPFPTRCWLAHNVSRGGSSTFKLEGWDVQPIHLN